MSCGVGFSCSLDLVLLWLWHRPAATAPIQPLAWELSYATGAAVKKEKEKEEKKMLRFIPPIVLENEIFTFCYTFLCHY